MIDKPGLPRSRVDELTEAERQEIIEYFKNHEWIETKGGCFHPLVVIDLLMDDPKNNS